MNVPNEATERLIDMVPKAKRDPGAILDLIAIERERGRRSLKGFMQVAWDQVQPGQGIRDDWGRFNPIWNWHLDAVCDHFEAFIRGDINRLLVNVPPRSTKSTTGSVCAPVWAWVLNPGLQFLTCSYRDDLSTRDSVRSRRLIQSMWFQARFGGKFELSGDQNQKTRYENNKGGHRIAQSVSGGSTGEGGDRIIVDDPHNTRRAESDVERTNALNWWDEEMNTRLNNTLTGGLCIIMQRLHEQDLSGHLLAKEQANFVHLMLPMEYEPERACTTVYVRKRTHEAITFEDPRSEAGEALDEVRFSEEAIADLKSRMSIYAVAGQLQQRPAPRDGGMFNPSMFKIIPEQPAQIRRVVRYWDKAGTDKSVAKGTGSHTAGVLMGKVADGPYKGCFIVLDVVRGQWAAGMREQVIENTAHRDGVKVKVYVEQEPGSGGKESAESTIKNLAGFKVEADRVTGDKVIRAEPYSSQQIVGNILLLNASWNQAFIHEHEMFPVGAQKDQVDAAAGAFNKLSAMREKRLSW